MGCVPLALVVHVLLGLHTWVPAPHLPLVWGHMVDRLFEDTQPFSQDIMGITFDEFVLIQVMPDNPSCVIRFLPLVLPPDERV